jgi:NAD(P)-dependent dehydrogenase (short-subunit alcohol dehydrogenase family)
MKLKGKTAIITGASQGLGVELAKAFAVEGANVVISARNEKRLKEVKEQIVSTSNTNVLLVAADVAKREDNDRLVAETVKAFGSVDVFIANAGVYGPKGPIETVDWEEWVEAININMNGVVLGCRSVLPHMKQKKKGKIIILSGGGATKPMPNLSAYAVSKAGVMRFMETLAGEVASYNIDVNAIAPGALNTRLLDEVLAAGPEAVGEAFYQASLKQRDSGGTPLTKGAELCIYLAGEESNQITGKLISAVWDPWESLHLHKDDLRSTDIYTLRRIVPEDRNRKW